MTYSSALKNGIKFKHNRENFNSMELIEQLENHYGGSETFSGKKNGILSEILDYKFKKCFVCKKYLENNNNFCRDCINLSEEDCCVYMDICPSCNDYHEVDFTVDCQLCNKEVNIICVIDEIEVCRNCLGKEEEIGACEEVD